MGKRQKTPTVTRYAKDYAHTREIVPVGMLRSPPVARTRNRRGLMRFDTPVCPDWFAPVPAWAADTFATSHQKAFGRAHEQHAGAATGAGSELQRARAVPGAAGVVALTNDEQLEPGVPQGSENAVYFKPMDTINKSDLTELKALPHPPAGVVRTVQAACRILGLPTGKLAWPYFKDLLYKNELLPLLKQYDFNRMDPGLIEKLGLSFRRNPECQPSAIAKVSKAAVGLSMWCHNVHENAAMAHERRTCEAARRSKAKAWPLCYPAPPPQRQPQPPPPPAPYAMAGFDHSVAEAVTTTEATLAKSAWQEQEEAPGRKQRLGVWSETQQANIVRAVQDRIEQGTGPSSTRVDFLADHALPVVDACPTPAGQLQTAAESDFLKHDDIFRGSTDYRDGLSGPGTVGWAATRARALPGARLEGRPALGVAIMGSQFYPMIPGGAPAGTSSRQEFALGHGSQSEIFVLVLEGESVVAAENKLLMAITLRDIPETMIAAPEPLYAHIPPLQTP